MIVNVKKEVVIYGYAPLYARNYNAISYPSEPW